MTHKTNKTYLIIIAISAFVIFLNNLPLVFGLLNQKNNLVFLGRRNINSQDLYTYVSFIEQAKDGRWLFENLYMSEDQQPRLLRPSYIAIGKAAWLFNLPPIWAYHLARIVLMIVFMAVLYSFLKLFFENQFWRIAAYVLTLTSSGFGLFFGKWAAGSADLWIPEAITFLSLAEAPHFILAQILMISGFGLFIKGYFRWAAFAFFALTFEHPFNLGVVGLTLILTTSWLTLRNESVGELTARSLARRPLARLRGLLIILGSSAAGVVYQIYEINQNHVLQSWAAQNKLDSPDPLHWLLGYGAIIFLALIGAEKFLKENKPGQILIASWVATSAVLLYSPIFFQRRFSEGLHIPLSILATFGILAIISFLSKFVLPQIRQLFGKFLLTALILFLAAGSIWQITNDVRIIASDSPSYYYYHLHQGEMQALAWLRTKTAGQDTILANWFYGNLIPGLTGRKVYVGHRVQTPYFDEKIEKINNFLLNKNSTQAHDFLKSNGITYIFLGKNDTMLQYGFKPYEKPYLIEVYNKNDVLIFKMKLGP